MNRITKYILFVTIVLVLVAASYPSIIKIQFSFPDELEYSTYHIYEDNVEVTDTKQFFDGNLVVPFDYREKEELKGVLFIYDETVVGDLKRLNSVRASMGNYMFYEGNVDGDGLYTLHDIHINNDGTQTIIGENPYIIFSVPYHLLNEKKAEIWIKQVIFWLLTVLALSVAYKKSNMKLLICKIVEWFAAERGNLFLLVIIETTCAGVGFSLQIMNNKWFHFAELQNQEMVFWLLVTGLVSWLIYRRTRSLKYTIFASFFVGIFLLLSIKGMITFLTADEHAAIQEQAKLTEDDGLRHWLMSSSWSNYAIMGTFWRIFPREWMEVVTGLDYKQIGKLVHWFIGCLLLIFIGDLVQRRILNRKKNLSSSWIAGNYIILYMVSFLLPVVTMALKSYNYDLFSLTFGALGGIYSFLAFRDKSVPDACKAIVFSFLGGIEKMTAIPMIAIACVIFVYLMVEGREKSENIRKKILQGFFASLASVGALIFLTFMVSHYVLGYLKEGNAPITTWVAIIDITFSRMGSFNKLGYLFTSNGFAAGLLSGFFFSILVFLTSLLLFALCNIEEKGKEKAVRRGSLVLCGMVMLFAGLGLFFSVVGIEYSENKLQYFCYIIQNYALSTPTILLILLAVGMINIRHVENRISILTSMCIVTWGVIPAYMMKIRWNPTWARYLNLYLYLFCLLVVVISMPVLYQSFKKVGVTAGLLGTLCLFHASEVYGSMPGYTYFAPLWYGLTIIGKPVEEREMVVYWGDNRASLGLKIMEYRCRNSGIQDKEIDVYYGYIRGTWFTKPDYINIQPKEWNKDYQSCGVAETDFYAMDTQAVHREMIKDGWPENVNPVIEVKYRGYVLARIYQGTQLREYFGKM